MMYMRYYSPLLHLLLNYTIAFSPAATRNFAPLTATFQKFHINDQKSSYIEASTNTIAQEEFIETVQTSLQDSTFLNFTLHGPSAKKKKKNKKKTNNNIEKIEFGTIKSVAGRLVELKLKTKTSKAYNNKQKNKPASTSPNSNSKSKSKSKTVLHVNTKYFGATDIAKNWDYANDVGIVEQNLNGLLLRDDDDDTVTSSVMSIQRGELCTTLGTYKLTISSSTKQSNNSKSKLVFSKHKQALSEEEVQAAIHNTKKHDRAKNVPLDPSAKFLQLLGVSNQDGKPRPGMASKLRQCQRFCEIVGGLVETSLSNDDNSDESSSQQQRRALTSVDMGCGRGYLTFSLHSHLHQRGIEVQSRGVEMRPKLVQEINDIARKLDYDCDDDDDEFKEATCFQSLQFVEGTIESYMNSKQQSDDDNDSCGTAATSTTASSSSVVVDNSNNDSNNNVDILIALHACDTATDDALWYGIDNNARIIVTAPCCHKEVRRQLDPFIAVQQERMNKERRKQKRSSGSDGSAAAADVIEMQQQQQQPPHPLADVLRHAIYRERMSETATDSMRALLLEMAGYEVQVFEFIGGEHTAKNVMIAATKKTIQGADGSRRDNDDDTTAKAADLQKRLSDLAAMHGVKQLQLAKWMGVSLVGDEEAARDDNDEQCQPSSPPVVIGKEQARATVSSRRMPPLRK